ncbi:MAG TPA: hypothetical protein DIW31_01660 [Bacteroidales bacterium]|nr:hypothetical protein [Bacteroidales bacterium]
MKSLLTILMVALIGSAVNANPGSKGDYLLTNDGKFVAANVHLGVFKIHAKTNDGCVLEANYKDVMAYQKDGETYSKKPLYNDRRFAGNVFMKKISWRNGLGLYCYEDPTISSTDNKRYFVFKDETTFWLEVDSKSLGNIKNFFGRM